MPFYVFAIVDRPPLRRPGRGFSAPLSFRRVGGAFAAVERRADVPPPEFGVLRKHQAIVSRLARMVPAILPVRFGTLLDSDELAERLLDRDEDLAAAFALVRNRVQVTWRGAAAPRRGRPAAGGAAAKVSGADYLRHAAAAARPAPPALFRRVRTTLGPMTAAEIYQAPAGTRPEALYHLVEAKTLRGYLARAARVQRADPRLTLTGPWPPFAFVPEAL